MNDLTIEQFTEERIKKFTIPKLKAFIKKKQLVKNKRCTRKQHYIDCILENKDYIFSKDISINNLVKDIKEQFYSEINFLDILVEKDIVILKQLIKTNIQKINDKDHCSIAESFTNKLEEILYEYKITHFYKYYTDENMIDNEIRASIRERLLSISYGIFSQDLLDELNNIEEDLLDELNNIQENRSKSKPTKRLFHRVLRTPKTICYDKTKICIGLDEAGCGSMSHGVYIAACILPTECPTPNDEYKMTMWNSITDSKKYSSNKAKLHELCEYVKEVAIEWSLVIVGEKEIDEINIREARLVGFTRALNALKTNFNHILIDGDIFYNYYKDGKQIPHNCIKQGDSKFRSIAAASLIAKSSRDRYMIEAHKEFPMYNWNKNFGYCGSNHLGLIREHGITKYHRKTFGLCKQWRTLPQGNLTDFSSPKTLEEKMTDCLFEDDDD